MTTARPLQYQASRTKKYQLDLARYYRIPAVQTSLPVVLSIMIVAFFVMFALRPTLVTIVNLQKTIEESKKTLSQLEVKVAALNQVNVIMEGVKPKLGALDASIPMGTAGYDSLESALTILAEQAGVKYDSSNLGGSVLFTKLFAPFTLTKNSGAIPLTFDARVSGNYTQINQYLQSIMKMDRLVAITGLNFGRDNKSEDSDNLTLTIMGTTYYMADEAQLAKAIPNIIKGIK